MAMSARLIFESHLGLRSHARDVPGRVAAQLRATAEEARPLHLGEGGELARPGGAVHDVDRRREVAAALGLGGEADALVVGCPRLACLDLRAERSRMEVHVVLARVAADAAAEARLA